MVFHRLVFNGYTASYYTDNAIIGLTVFGMFGFFFQFIIVDNVVDQ